MVDNDHSQGGTGFSTPLNDIRIIYGHETRLLCPTPIQQAAPQPRHIAVEQSYMDQDVSVVQKALKTAANFEWDTEQL